MAEIEREPTVEVPITLLLALLQIAESCGAVECSVRERASMAEGKGTN